MKPDDFLLEFTRATITKKFGPKFPLKKFQLGNKNNTNFYFVLTFPEIVLYFSCIGIKPQILNLSTWKEHVIQQRKYSNVTPLDCTISESKALQKHKTFAKFLLFRKLINLLDCYELLRKIPFLYFYHLLQNIIYRIVENSLNIALVNSVLSHKKPLL